MLQGTALDILRSGVNVFLTGEPGTGKTYTINEYVRWLREHGIEPAITASTGIAATHIGGMTIHSWCGIGVHEHLDPYTLDHIASNKRVIDRVQNTGVLIIDEISMLSSNTFGMVDRVCRTVKRNELPFGGMQVVLVGDFFQLPPIVKRSDDMSQDPEDLVSPFAFRSVSWGDVNPIVCYLHEQFRQHDTAYTQFLTSLRRGSVMDRSQFESRIIEENEIPETVPRLFARNLNVDRLNLDRLRATHGKEREFLMRARGSQHHVDTLKRGCLSPEALYLRIGAKVMCTKNDPGGRFVNGTLGEVTGFGKSGDPTIKTHDGRTIEMESAEWKLEDGGKTLASISQIPLRLAWAVTIHKSQGMTLDAAAIDLSDAFEYGQGYVALSRVRSFDGLYLSGYNERSLQVHPEVREYDISLKKNSAAARAMFESMPKVELTALIDRFIAALGGSTESTKGSKKKTSRAQGKKKGSSIEVTLQHIKDGKSLTEISGIRSLAMSTIVSHVVELYMQGKLDHSDIETLISEDTRRNFVTIEAALQEHGTEKLAPAYAALGGHVSYDELQLARLLCL